MTYRKWLISKLAKARKEERRAAKQHSQAMKEQGNDGSDENWTNLFTTQATVNAFQCALEAHREMEKQ